MNFPDAKGVSWPKASLDLVIGWLDGALISAFPGALALEYRRRTSVPHKNVKQTQWYPLTRTHPISVWRTSRHKSALSSGSSVTDEMWCGSSERHAPTASTWGTDVFRKGPLYPRRGTTRAYLFGKGSRLSQLQLPVGGPINPHCSKTRKQTRRRISTIIVQLKGKLPRFDIII